MEDCYSRLSQSFYVRGWLSKELKNFHLDDCLEFVDDLQFVYLDEWRIGLVIEDMVTFLSSSPELARRQYTSYVFEFCCLCLGHVVPELSRVSLGSFDENKETICLIMLSLYKTIFWVAVPSRASLRAPSLLPQNLSCRLSWNISLWGLDVTRG